MDMVEVAACRGMDPLFFFPDLLLPEGRHRGMYRRDHPVAQVFDAAVDAALRVCDGCQVVRECYERRGTSVVGVWGGTHRADPRRVQKHGTMAGWRRHLRRGEVPCRSCVECARDSGVASAWGAVGGSGSS